MVKKTKENQVVANLGDYAKQGGPGRPPGSKNHDGLNAVLQMLKDLVSREENLALIQGGLQEALTKNPVGFYYRFIMPMMPRQVNWDGESGGVLFVIPERIVPKKNSNNAK